MGYKHHALRLIEQHCQWRQYDRKMYLCWNAKINKNYSFEQVFERMANDHFHGMADALVCIPDKTALEMAWVKLTDLDDIVIEDMRRSFTEDDTMKCCSPKTYKRFSYTATDELWDTKYAFVGRSGGWLALTEFESAVLDADFDNFERGYWGPGEGQERWYQKLCCMIVEITWSVDNRHDEYLYQHAFQMHNLVEQMGSQ